MVNTLGRTPLMTAHEIRIMQRELLRLSKNGRKLEILEWGSGGSTHYFTKFLQKEGIEYEWVSIEYNKDWFEKIKQEVSLDTGIKMYLFDAGNGSLKQRHTEMDEYIQFPRTLEKKFDLIFVDGRKRRRCVLEAKSLLTPDGVVLLHDAQRKYYQCVFKEFSDSSLVGPSLWRGTHKSVSFLYALWQKKITFLFGIYFNYFFSPVRSLVKKIYHIFRKY